MVKYGTVLLNLRVAWRIGLTVTIDKPTWIELISGATEQGFIRHFFQLDKETLNAAGTPF